MQPLPMNELVKSQMEAVGFQVTLDTMDWNALLDLTRADVDKYPDISAINVSRQTQDPFNALIRHVWSKQWAPKGANWGHYSSPAVDRLVEQIYGTFDPKKRLVLLTKLNEAMNEEAVTIFVAHDLNPRALSPKIHGFVQAQSWFQDLTPVSVAPWFATSCAGSFRGQRRLLIARLYSTRRPLGNGDAAGCDGRDHRHRQACLRLRQAAADAVPDLARPMTGNLGVSIATGRPVILEVTDALANTALLALFAVPISFFIGYVMGVVAGCFPGRWLDRS
jgi:hypothetical protein